MKIVKLTRYKIFSLTTIVFIIIIVSCKFNNDQDINNEELRAIWLHQGVFDKSEKIARSGIIDLFNSYKEIGVNNLFCYNTLMEQHDLGWDYLQILIDEGHKCGIKIHPVFCPGHKVKIEGEIKDHPEWLIHGLDSTIYPNLNLTIPGARNYWMCKITKALDYDIDGIHLDYLRFPVNQQFSYDSITCSRFKQQFGYSPVEVAHNCGSMIWCEWIKWNADQVTALLREIRETIDRSGKNILLGADVFPDYASAQILTGQGWDSWIEEGSVDFVCPMLYTNNSELFGDYVARAVELSGNDCAVYPGIGVATTHNKITKELLIEEISIAREKGAGGVAFFSGYSFNKEFRDTLKTTVFSNRQPENVPR